MNKKILTIWLTISMLFSVIITVDVVIAEDAPEISFVKNEVENTLTVIAVTPSDVLWSDIENVGSGSCNIPSTEYVETADVIVDCFGTVRLMYVPLHIMLATFDFSEETDDTEKFVGTWDFVSSPDAPPDWEGTVIYKFFSNGNFRWYNFDDPGSYDMQGTWNIVDGQLQVYYASAGTSYVFDYFFSDGDQTLTLTESNTVILSKTQNGGETPSITFSYNSLQNKLTITSVDSGFYYSDSPSTNDANLVFKKGDITYYIIIDASVGLTIETYGLLTTQEIRAGDKISGFTPGTYSMVWLPYSILIGEFTVPEAGTNNTGVIIVSEPIRIGLGWIEGTVYGTTEEIDYDQIPLDPETGDLDYMGSLESYFPLKNAKISVISQSINNEIAEAITDENGHYNVTVFVGEYSVIASKQGQWYQHERSVKVNENQSSEIDFFIQISEDRLKIEKSIDNGSFGGEINVQLGQSQTLDYEIIIYDSVTIQQTEISQGEISITVGGDESSAGKTIAINTDEYVFDINGDFVVEYDGAKITMADDINDILNPNDDGSHPEYLIAIGAKGLQILVSVPHFSEHTITISSLEEVVEALGGITAVVLYIAIIAIVGILYVVPIWFFQKK